MTANSEAASYNNSQSYRDAMGYFQRGDWENGQRYLKRVIDEFPLEIELQQVRQQMEMRARLQVEEQQDDKRKRQRSLLMMAIRLVLAAGILAGLGWAGVMSFSFFEQQWREAEWRFQEDFETLQMRSWMDNAQRLYAFGRANDAQELVVRLKDKGVDTPELRQLEDNISLMLESDFEYQDAKRLYNSGNYVMALPRLEKIDREKPNYRDVPLLIEQIYQALYLESIVNNADAAFYSGRWEEAISGYREISSLNPDYRRDYIQDRLFESLLKAAEAVVSNPTGTLKDLDTVEGYFRQALVLRPQSQEVKAQRALVRSTIEERLYWSFINDAEDLLAENTDQLDVLERVEERYRQALQLRLNDSRASTGLELARKYVKAQNDFDNGRWTLVIEGLEYVCGVDFNYARGTARHTLYEAYMMRGDSLLAGALYESAQEDIRRAAMLAAQDSDSNLKVYQAQIRLANIQGLQGNFEEAVNIYRGALELSGFGARVQAENAILGTKLADAERYVQQRNYQTAFRLYREVVTGSEAVYETVKHIVQPGEYLTSIAARYRTTVSAIVELNNIANPNRIKAGIELAIPVLPDR